MSLDNQLQALCDTTVGPSSPEWTNQIEQFKQSLKTTVLDGKDIPFAVNDILDRMVDPFFPVEDRSSFLHMVQQVLDVELSKIKPPEEEIEQDFTFANRDDEQLTTMNTISKEDIKKKEIDLRPITVQEAENRIYDFSLELEERIHAIEIVCKHDPVYFENILSKISAMFDFSNTCIVNEYLLAICKIDTVPLLERLSTVTRLCMSTKNTEVAYTLLAELCQEWNEGIPLVVYMEKVFLLVVHDRKYSYIFDRFLTNTTIDEQLRYAYVVKSKVMVNVEFFAEYMWKILELDTFGIRFKIMCCSNLLSIDDIQLTTEQQRTILDQLCVLMDNSSLEMNLRADAADILLNCGDEFYSRAKQTLINMGEHGLGILSTIYDNKQNAHFTNTEKNVRKIIQQLLDLDVRPSETPMDEIKQYLYNSYFLTPRHSQDRERFEFSLFRITHQIGKIVEGYSLLTIFLLVYGYIEQSRYQKHMEIRLVEELIDMSETCTTGYYSRLLNALSGYGGFQFEIDWETQIQANLVGRLRACIRDDEKFGEILEELTIQSFVEKPELRRIYQQNISTIIEEMRSEFVEHMSANDFDLYLRKALVHFEGHNFDET